MEDCRPRILCIQVTSHDPIDHSEQRFHDRPHLVNLPQRTESRREEAHSHHEAEPGISETRYLSLSAKHNVEFFCDRASSRMSRMRSICAS